MSADSQAGVGTANQGRWVIGPDGGWRYLYDRLPKEKDEVDCKEELEKCITKCLGFLDKGDYGVGFQKCRYECMEDAGCSS